jgi:hypothetical protein
VPGSKIVNEQEVIRWYEEGRTYQWMVEEYERRYALRVVPSTFGNFRRRRGLERRITRNDDLIPWHVKHEHRWAYPLQMLRAEARRRAGRGVRDDDMSRLEPWLDKLRQSGAVVHYEPETEQGFFYVPRRPGVDVDLIREPELKTTLRRAAD